MRLHKIALTTLALATLAAHAQTPTLQVYSRETVVDVTVTDAKGQPVHGLKHSDFALKEDGKPQPIRSFHEYGTQTIPSPPKLPPNVHTNLQPPPPSSAVNILLLDFINAAPVYAVTCCRTIPAAGPQDLARAMQRQRMIKQEAMKYLQGMPAGTRVAVLGMSDPGTLQILQGVTSDPALLSAAVDTMEYDTTAMADYEPLALPDHLHGTWCAQQERRNRATLEVLDQAAADLAGIKGRKNLIWFTIGIPTMTSPPPGCLPDYSRDINKAFGLLAAAQVTVFPVGARGVAAVGAPPPYAENWPAEELSMEAVAEATGGVAYYNPNDLAGAITKAIEAGSDFYTLTYAPPGTEYDGRHHTINLKLNLDPPRPGLHLTYRNSYYAEDPAKLSPKPGLSLAATPASATGDLHAQMGRSMPTSTELLFDVRVQPTTGEPKLNAPRLLGVLDPRLKNKPLTRYDFLFLVPAKQITFANGLAGTHAGSLEFDIAAYDTEGKPVTSLDQTMQFPLSADEYQQFIKVPFQFFQQLDLPPGQLFLRIGVLDGNSKKLGTLEIPITISKPTQPQ